MRLYFVLFAVCACIAAVVILFSDGREAQLDQVAPSTIEEDVKPGEAQASEGTDVEEDSHTTSQRRELVATDNSSDANQATVPTENSGPPISGRVTKDGVPVVGATVEMLEQWRPSFPAIEITNEAGEFRFDFSAREFKWFGDSFKQLRVTTLAQGTFSYQLFIEENQRPFHLKLPPWTGELYSVQVVDSRTQRVRVGVPLTYSTGGVDGAAITIRNVMTDADGVARFSSQEPVRIKAQFGELSGGVDLTSGQAAQPVSFEGVPEFAALQPVDVDTMEPIPSVQAEWPEPSAFISRVRTDIPDPELSEEGIWTWRASDHPNSGSCDIVFLAPDYLSRHVRCEVSSDGSPVKVWMASGSGQVAPHQVQVVAAGEPVADAQVTFSVLQLVTSSESAGPSDTTTATVFDFARAGPFQTNSQGHVPLQARDFWGRYKTSGFKATVTAADGSEYEFRIPESAVRGRAVIVLDISPPTATIVFTLGPDGDSIRVAVACRDYQNPRLVSLYASRQSGRRSLQVDPGVQLEVPVLAGVPMSWSIPADSGFPGSEGEFTLAAGEVQVVELPELKRGKVSGRVVNLNGEAWMGKLSLELLAVLDDGNLQQIDKAWARTDLNRFLTPTETNFWFLEVPVGEYALRVVGAPKSAEPLRVKPGDHDVLVRLPARCTVTLRISGRDGAIDRKDERYVGLSDRSRWTAISNGVAELTFWPGVQKGCFVYCEGYESQWVELPTEMPLNQVVRKQVVLEPGRDVTLAGVPMEVAAAIDRDSIWTMDDEDRVQFVNAGVSEDSIYFYGLPMHEVQVELVGRDGETWRRTVAAGVDEVVW